MLYNNPAAAHIAPKIAKALKMKQGKILFDRFPDGEIRVRVQDIPKQRALMVAGWPSPADNVWEALLGIDALRRCGVPVDLLITYFGYARSDKPAAGEPAVLHMLVDALLCQGLEKIWTVDLHQGALKKMEPVLRVENLIPTTLWAEEFADSEIDVVLSPDLGYKDNAEALAKRLGCDSAWIEKLRRKDKPAAVELHGTVKGSRVLIVDDILSTGETLDKAARLAVKHGAREVWAAVTHAVLARGHEKIINKSPIECVTLSNSLNRKSKSKKVCYVDASEWIASRIARSL